jgi:serine/threonine protein kinase
MTEREIFLAALERDDPTERAAYLDQACGADATLRQRVEALLRSHERATDFLEVPVVEQLAGDDGGLDFLAPSQKPDSLGCLAHYEVLEVVGRGGMGVVFRAFDTKLHRVVALKVLAPQLATNSAARQRFVREARAAAAVSHEHIIAIHTVEDTGPVPYLVMQFIDGPTLQKKLDRTGLLSLKQILRIGLQIAEGLAAAHRQGLVHRDIKPANILLENGVERVKITDFGLARAGDDASLTQSGVVAGTPMYMSPEQADGLPVDFRSDLFSLGSVLYAMCAGRPPFRAPSALAVLKRVCEATPRPIREINPELPPWLEEVVVRLHAKAPADRFASAREVADLLARRLAELQDGGTPSAPGHAPSAKLPEEKLAPTPPARPRRLRVMAAAVLLALLAGLGLSEATGITNVRGTVIRLFSPEGTLVVEVDDPGISVSLNGEELVITGAGVREVRLKPGQYEMKATKEGKLIRQELVTVTKDGRQVVRVSREPAPAQVAAAETAAWERTVAALPAEEQVKAVAARLKDLNPGFDGKVTPTITDDIVSGLQFSTDQVTNIMPVRALAKLTVLDVSGKSGKLTNLSALKGMPLSILKCNHTKVADLSPLKGLPLTWLECGWTAVSDLTPLKGMPLRGLFCQCPQVSDLSPLQGMRLESLDVAGSGVTDLSPLQGMPLTTLDLYGATQLRNLSPLKGMSLKYLNLGRSPVTDLSPLGEMMTLTQLWLDYQPERDAEALRSIKGLVQINGMPAGEFLKAQGK